MSRTRMTLAGMAMKLAAISAGAIAVSMPAAAAERGFYFGGLGGQADYEFGRPEGLVVAIPGPVISFSPTLPPGVVAGFVSNPSFAGPVSAVSATQIAFSDPDADDSDIGWGTTVGYRIFDYAAVELSYLDLGSLSARDEFPLPIFLGGGTVAEAHTLDTAGPSISVLGMMPLTEQWDLFLRVGVFFADQEVVRTITSSNPNVLQTTRSATYGSDTGLYGAGVQYNWKARWSVRLDYQRYNDVGDDETVGEADVDLLSLNVLYRL